MLGFITSVRSIPLGVNRSRCPRAYKDLYRDNLIIRYLRTLDSLLGFFFGRF